MRRLLLAAAVLLTISGARAETLWVAEARVIAVTPQCGTTARVGDFFRAIYRPMGASIGNGADSHLALFSQRSSFWMRVPNNTFRGSINYVGHYINSTLIVRRQLRRHPELAGERSIRGASRVERHGEHREFLRVQGVHRDAADAVHAAALKSHPHFAGFRRDHVQLPDQRCSPLNPPARSPGWAAPRPARA